jgi:hypothetical protein
VNLLNPLGLLGLVVLPVIVLLHLKRERSKRVIVSNIEFWSFLDVQLRGNIPRRIPFSLLLILDLLIAFLLSLILAQPQVNIESQIKIAKHMIILVDVSTSMLADDVSPSRFAAAQSETLRFLSSMDERDVATVISFGDEVHRVGDTREIGIEELTARINQLKVGGRSNLLESALAIAVSEAEEQLPVEIHVLSDCAFPEPMIMESGFPVEWHRMGTPSANQAVLDVSARRVGDNQLQVFGVIANFGDEDISTMVMLLADGTNVSPSDLVIQPNSKITRVWNITGQPSTLSVSLLGNDILSADDHATVGVSAEREVSVALVAEEPAPIDRAIEAVDNANLRILGPEEYIQGMSFDLVIFRNSLPSDWPQGNILVVDPPSESSLLEISDPVKISSLPIYTQDTVLQGVDFSGVRWGNVPEVINIPEEFKPIVKAGTLPLLMKAEFGPSNITLFLPSLNDGNITRHPAFPILISNLVSLSRGDPIMSQVNVGEPIEIKNVGQYSSITVTDPEGITYELESGAERYDNTTLEGLYEVVTTDLDGEVTTHRIGVNAGHAEESYLLEGSWVKDQEADPLESEIMSLSTTDLTPWLLGLLILLLVFEAWIAWR